MKLTVFMPVYNREKYIKDSISSILNQDYKDFELLIIDDGSTDKSIEIINSFKDDRIRLLKNEVNKGVVYTRNRGLEEAKGEYILLLDSDDIALPGRLKRQTEFMEKNKDAIIVFSAYISSYPNGDKFKSNIIEEYDKINPMMIFKNCISNGSSMIKKSLVMEHDIRYRKDFFYGEDYAFAVDLMKYGKAYGQNEILSQFNYESTNSITRTVKAKRRKEITEKIMFNIRKSHLENNNIYLTDKQIMNICEVTAQPTLTEYEDLILFLDTLNEIKKQNTTFVENKLNIVLEEISNESIYYSQKINYKTKIKIMENNYTVNKKDLFIYHIKYNVKNLLDKLVKNN